MSNVFECVCMCAHGCTCVCFCDVCIMIDYLFVISRFVQSIIMNMYIKVVHMIAKCDSLFVLSTYVQIIIMNMCINGRSYNDC